MTFVSDHEAVAKRAEQLEREAERQTRLLAEAKAVAGPEYRGRGDTTAEHRPEGDAVVVTDGGQDTRVRLEEVLADVEALEGQLIEPLTLGPAIDNLEATIEAYDRIGE